MIKENMNKKKRDSLLLVCFVVFLATCSDQTTKAPGSPATPVTPRNPAWAVEVKNEHLSNFYKISDNVYRSAQPSSEGMKELEKMGIKTVLNLRRLHSDRDEIEDLDLLYYHIKFNPLDPDEDEVVRFLEIITNKSNHPVLIHCRHGSDRTGMMAAVYRIVVQGWTNEDAAEEMVKGGYGYHSIFKDVLSFVKKLNVEKYQQKTED